jgi:hypothetical protein
MAILALLAGSAAITSSAERSTSQTPKSQQSTGLFKFIQTVQVSPDEEFKSGEFVRINYVPATDHLIVTFGTRGRLSQEAWECAIAGLAYKEYTLAMEVTGKSGILNCEIPDFGSVMVDNTYYFVSMHLGEEYAGWRIIKYNAVTWESLANIFHPLNLNNEEKLEYRRNGDPMVSYVNGQLDISAGYNPAGTPPPTASHHQFFSTDLNYLGEKILLDTPHIDGAAMIYLDGIYYFITANAFDGDVVLMQYDRDWKYLGVKTLIKEAHWSTGLAYDGQRFYLAYMDTSQRTTPGFLPVYLNVHLAAFDRDWNLVEDVAVTNFARADNKQPGRPWVILHDNRLYLSYDLSDQTATDPASAHAFVSVYELLFRTNPTRGTIGTEMTILGSELGTGKGKVLVGKSIPKILDWKDDSIRCLLTKALPPDIYDVTIQPQAKGSSPIIIEDGFTVKAPEIGPLDPISGSPGDQVTIHGLFFGTKKGKVTLEGKICKVLSWTMDSTTGVSEIQFVVPKGLSAGAHELKVITTGVGWDTVNFIVE